MVKSEVDKSEHISSLSFCIYCVGNNFKFMSLPVIKLSYIRWKEEEKINNGIYSAYVGTYMCRKYNWLALCSRTLVVIRMSCEFARNLHEIWIVEDPRDSSSLFYPSSPPLAHEHFYEFLQRVKRYIFLFLFYIFIYFFSSSWMYK